MLSTGILASLHSDRLLLAAGAGGGMLGELQARYLQVHVAAVYFQSTTFSLTYNIAHLFILVLLFILIIFALCHFQPLNEGHRQVQ